jgi:hypothetical protein
MRRSNPLAASGATWGHESDDGDVSCTACADSDDSDIHIASDDDDDDDDDGGARTRTYRAKIYDARSLPHDEGSAAAAAAAARTYSRNRTASATSTTVAAAAAATAAAAAAADEIAVVGGDGEGEVSTLLTPMGRLRLLPLSDRSLGVTVQFFSGDDTSLDFLFETSLLTAPPSALRKFYSHQVVTPLRVNWNIVPRSTPPVDDGAAAACAAAAATTTTSEEDEYAEEYVSETGRLNVILCIGGHDSVLVGYYTTRFDFAAAPSLHGPAAATPETLDSMRVGGKRIAWRDACVATKRARSADGTPHVATSVFVEHRGPDPTPGCVQWNSASDAGDTQVYAERDAATGAIRTVRLALHIQMDHVYDELQKILDVPDRFYPAPTYVASPPPPPRRSAAAAATECTPLIQQQQQQQQ